MQEETQVWFLGWEYPLEKKMATHSSIFAWDIPWTEEPGRLQSMGLQTVRHNLVTKQLSHPAISSSVVPFSSCPQSLPASESFLVSQLFAWAGQSAGVSASESVLSMNTQDWSALGWTDWPLCSPKDSEESSPTPQFKSINSSALSFLHSPTLTSIHDHWKNHSLD